MPEPAAAASRRHRGAATGPVNGWAPASIGDLRARRSLSHPSPTMWSTKQPRECPTAAIRVSTPWRAPPTRRRRGQRRLRPTERRPAPPWVPGRSNRATSTREQEPACRCLGMAVQRVGQSGRTVSERRVPVVPRSRPRATRSACGLQRPLGSVVRHCLRQRGISRLRGIQRGRQTQNSVGDSTRTTSARGRCPGHGRGRR